MPIFVMVAADGVVEHCISVDDVADLVEFYPEHTLIERVGDETVGWTYDGVSFAPPKG